MATSKDYFVEYNFATNEGHFETPEEYERRIMVDVPPAHKFLKELGITQKVYDNVKAIHDTSKDAIAKYKGEHGDEWYKKSSPKNDLFTDGRDKILELTFSQIKPDANRMPDGLRKNGLTVMNILFFSLIDDSDFMEIYLEKENRKDKSIYGQGMDRPIGYILKIVDELDSSTDDPIDTFILSYILFKQYDLLMMMDISLKNAYKEDGAKIIGIYSTLVYLYSYQKDDIQLVEFIEDKYQYFKDTKTKKTDNYDLWLNSFMNPGPYNWCYPFLQFVDTSILEKIMFNVFKEGISFLLVFGAVLMVENKDLLLKSQAMIEEQEFDPMVIRAAILSVGAKLSEKNVKFTTQDSPRPPEHQANHTQIDAAIAFCEDIKKVHGSVSKFFIKILKKVKIRSSMQNVMNAQKRVKVIDVKKLKKMKFSMRGGRRKTRKKSRKFYGDWEIVNVHTRRTRKHR